MSSWEPEDLFDYLIKDVKVRKTLFLRRPVYELQRVTSVLQEQLEEVAERRGAKIVWRRK